MSFAELLLISIGLAMDAFAVSLADGATRCGRRRALFIALLFGLFQAAMPIAGYFICSGFAELISAYDHYVALLALGFIGGKMIIESTAERRAGKAEPFGAVISVSVPSILLQAVATSIDALIVGVSLAATGEEIFSAAAVIGVVAFFFSLFGVLGGRRFGMLLGTKATLIGGIILVAIGIKTVVQHLFI